ncbi:hypothetical protein CKO_01787 [Citrobacter koseri ATCC BAA-895]|uniref:Uncharacterized protein n=1 Tax=Citrobacter koseri (strain ATCC BAA-895 / CDC 4225-83 / SGSC4696) TaxID=290338 RepID=A8AHF2_CITK8|nr:hypothetical protein CKO_01787 [Citrobacter koseri ATCC BAA-895]
MSQQYFVVTLNDCGDDINGFHHIHQGSTTESDILSLSLRDLKSSGASVERSTTLG